ncbi:MAG: 50S ribosomal protein L1 [Proteobacteria bacterium]|nr:50S ribosomal protein L1 [Pseudomonadota bacterium]
MSVSKRRKTILEKVVPGKVYPVNEAVKLLQECATAKFVESVDLAVNLGIDSRKSDQGVRGAIVLPHGTGRQVKVAVFAQGDKATAARSAGADIVGFEDLAEIIKGGTIEFDVLIATPDSMRIVGTLGQILGPRGLMPNPKVGTVTADVAGAVKNAKSGQVQYRNDKNGIVHCTVGKVNFEEKAIAENVKALISGLMKSKPATAKGVYFKKVTISSTMGPGLLVDVGSLLGGE